MYPLLAGLRIVDITTIILGPFATQILGDLGAEVIKVETIGGDMNRAIPPQVEPGIGPVFANNNRNKRSLAVDLKQAAGKEVLRRLIATSDALIHNMRQAALDRLGFSWDTVHQLNPRLVYCAAVGYGSDGPYAGKPAYDDIIQAAGGLAGLHQVRDGEPAFHPTVTADKVAALYVVHAVLAALLHRERTDGKGQYIEMPMFEAMAGFVLTEHLMSATFTANGPTGYHRALAPNRKPYRTADGWIAVLPYTAEQWRRTLTAVGRADVCSASWFNDNTARSLRSDELYGILGASLSGRTSREWLEVFEREDIPCGPVHTPDTLLTDPHLQTVGFFEPNFDAPAPMHRTLRQPVVYRGLERQPDRMAPRLGSDTASLLEELGYAREEIARLGAAGVIAGPELPTA